MKYDNTRVQINLKEVIKDRVIICTNKSKDVFYTKYTKYTNLTDGQSYNLFCNRALVPIHRMNNHHLEGQNMMIRLYYHNSVPSLFLAK